jgi:hypothetical protein
MAFNFEATSLSLSKQPGWQGRLHRLLRDAETHVFAWGVHDCLTLMCNVVETITEGVLTKPAVYGSYTTKEEALTALQGLNALELLRWEVSLYPVENVLMAQDGDILHVLETGLEKWMVAYNGEFVTYAMTKPGLLRCPLMALHERWNPETMALWRISV